MAAPPPELPDIDFLPADYREQHRQRRSQMWRLVIVLSVMCTIATAAFWQQRVRARLEGDLKVANWMFEQTAAHSSKLAELEARVANARQQAAILTFLRQPWPRTQILAAIVEPLPESIRLTEITIARSAIKTVRVGSSNLSKRSTGAKKNEQSRSPREETLRQLREGLHASVTEIDLHGISYDNPALHRYLAELVRHRLLVHSELLDLEHVEEGGEVRYHFTARITVAPPWERSESDWQPNKQPTEDRQAWQDKRFRSTGRGSAT